MRGNTEVVRAAAASHGVGTCLAPILAWNVVAQLGKSERLLAFGESLTLPGVLDRLVVSDDFWRTVLTVAFMASLNNVCTMLTKALLAPMPFARALLASR